MNSKMIQIADVDVLQIDVADPRIVRRITDVQSYSHFGSNREWGKGDLQLECLISGDRQLQGVDVEGLRFTDNRWQVMCSSWDFACPGIMEGSSDDESSEPVVLVPHVFRL